MLKKSRFRGHLKKQHGKRTALLSYLLVTCNEMCSKKFLLLTWQILGLLVNTLAADEKYPLLKRDNLTIPIQMHLSQKQNHFPQFFAPFLKSRLNFKYLKKKDDPYRFCNFEITDSKNVLT